VPLGEICRLRKSARSQSIIVAAVWRSRQASLGFRIFFSITMAYSQSRTPSCWLGRQRDSARRVVEAERSSVFAIRFDPLDRSGADQSAGLWNLSAANVG